MIPGAKNGGSFSEMMGPSIMLTGLYNKKVIFLN